MTRLRTFIEERLETQLRARWGPVIVEPALTKFVGAAVRLYWRQVAIPATVIPLLVVLLALGRRVPLGIGGMLLIAVGVGMGLRLPPAYARARDAAAEGLEIAGPDARKLNLLGPEALLASVRRVRGDGGRTGGG